MITITNTITIAIITIAIISIAIVTIPTISPGPNVHTYTLNPWKAGSIFPWTIWVGNLPSPRSNGLPFLQYLMLQLSTPWPWGIQRSRHSGHAEDKVQTIILTDVISSATPTHHVPPSTCHLPPSAWLLQLSKCLDWGWRRVHWSI